jgi:hypothetical protein
MPELAELGVGTITGVTSGTVRLDLDSERGLTWATARLEDLTFELRYRPLGQRSERRITLANQQDLLLTYSDERLHVVTARLLSSTPGQRSKQAEFSVGGFLDPAGSDLSIRGNVPLGLAEFFLARRVRRISGSARADVKLTGPLTRIQGAGSLAIDQVVLELPGFDRRLQLPSGELLLAPGELRLTQLIFRVGRQQLMAWGRIGLEPGSLVKPETVDLKLEGGLDMGLVQLAFPEQFSFARGHARIELALEGPVRDPRARGLLSVGQSKKSG